MKINWKVRLKNPYFWIGLLGVIFTATGLDASQFTSWGSVWSAFVDFWKNPYMVVSVILAIVGVIQDPTTASLGDSKRALTYNSPYKESVNESEIDYSDACSPSDIITDVNDINSNNT